ncbi:PQQ-dependent sugar dehydrogenase [Gymnodinialimonas sp. 2305UL16-5]|uniref:PQQ-dependent sugar dehydrogenase n=1 Tax=Gymnodinialimonas mytili TaxID=3126503 RepID=UPI0030B483F7
MQRALPVFLLAFASPALAQTQEVSPAGTLPLTLVNAATQSEARTVASDVTLTEQVVTGVLASPWSVAVLPDSAGYVVTERGGTLRHVTRDGTVGPEIAGVPNVRALRQGGLLDIALAPDFAESRVIYLSYAAPDGLAGSATALARAVLSDDHTALDEVTELWRQTPASAIPAHFGSRIIAFEDGRVLVTTGDRFTPENRQLAQDPINATYGVTIMIGADGAPEAPAVEGALPGVLSYGHRNIQGAALHPETGAIWMLEHGPAGGDELNIITPGANYGWPEVSYGVNYNGTDVGTGEQIHAPAFVEPIYFWDPSIAPSDMVFYQGDMFADWEGSILLGALAGQSLVRLELEGDNVIGEERLREGEGRVRDVAVDEDGAILVLIDDDPGALIRLTPEGAD